VGVRPRVRIKEHRSPDSAQKARVAVLRHGSLQQQLAATTTLVCADDYRFLKALERENRCTTVDPTLCKQRLTGGGPCNISCNISWPFGVIPGYCR